MRPLALAVLAAIVLAGCGGGSDESQGTHASGQVVRTIAVSETEFSLEPSSIRIDQAGTYVLRATNDGNVTHALELEGEGVEAETEDIAPGESADLRVSITKPGDYELYCPIGNHRDQGMEGTLVLGPGAGGETTTTGSGGGVGY